MVGRAFDIIIMVVQFCNVKHNYDVVKKKKMYIFIYAAVQFSPWFETRENKI